MKLPTTKTSTSSSTHGSRSSGISQTKSTIFRWYFSLTACNRVLYWTLKDSGEIFQPNDKYCNLPYYFDGYEVCSRGDLLAFYVTSIFPIFYVTYRSFLAYHITKTALAVPDTPEGRMFTRIDDCEQILAIQLASFVWATVACLGIPEYQDTLVLSYTVVNGLLCWWSLRHQYMQHYAAYFLCLANAVHIPALFQYLTDAFPFATSFASKLVESFWDVILVALACIFRFHYWRKYNMLLLRDFQYIKERTAMLQRPGKSYVLYTFVGLITFVGVLQATQVFLVVLLGIVNLGDNA